MCDSALSFTRDHLIPLARHHLLPLLKEAANMIRGVPKDVADLKDELESIEKSINDADRIAEGEEENTRHGIREKIIQLIEASFLIEDVIDEYMMCEEQQPGDNPGCVAGATDFLKTMTLRLQIAYKVQNIKSQISEIKDTSGKDYALQLAEGTSNSSATNRDTTTTLLQNLRNAPLYMNEADVVGFDVPRDHLIDLLVTGRSELTVVSVIAMGGQGKTTLAKKVFDSTRVTQHFDSCVWITVSETYTIEVLLRNLLQKLYKKESRDPPKEIHEMGPQALRDEVRKFLKQKRYVIVFDDVWNILFWADIEFAVIDNNNQSRILITSRNVEVVMSCKRSSFVEVYKLQPLTLEKSLELFNKKAFRNLNGCCPNNLMIISSKIVEKCNGLPLAIVVIGGLLSGKDINAVQWQKFSESMSLELKEHSQLIQIRKIIGFSYHDLPYNLKSCLLYFGMYPEDFRVNSRNLIRQWIAEGFVKEKRGKTLEEVGEGYLMELIHRSLVQVSSISIDGRVKTCRVHDLIHMMILEKFEDLKFCRIDSKVGESSSLSGITRRLSLTDKSNDHLPGIFESSHVRSLFILKMISSPFVVTKYKLLKVFAFENPSLSSLLPENLGSLIHLRYLRYRMSPHGSITTLPKSIGMLQNLDTLDLRGMNLIEMPKEITMLKKLRHLLGNAKSWIQLKDGIGSMRSLQTLVCVALPGYTIETEIKEATVEFVKEIGQLEQLRKLSLFSVRKIHETALISLTKNMQQLEKLNIKSDDEEVIDFHLFSPSPMLRSLTLCGELEKFPMWIPELQNLVKLKLESSRLTMDLLKSLQKMQNLMLLSITKHAYEGDTLHFEEKGFQNLKELYLGDSDSLSSIVIDKGALPSLEKLSLDRIPKLTLLPEGIQHLKTLKLLWIGYMVGFKRGINALLEGRKHWIFQHLPFLKVHIKGLGSFFKGSRLGNWWEEPITLEPKKKQLQSKFSK